MDTVSVGSGNDNDDVSAKSSPYLPPCRVCASPASGFHYGVNTCEACKGFFRRSIARKTPYALCSGGEKCLIELQGRNSCPACRFKKCLRQGMSKSAIKTGRYTHEKRTRDTLEIKCIKPSTDTCALLACSSPGDGPSASRSRSSIDSQPKNTASSRSSSDRFIFDAVLEQTLSVVNSAFHMSFRDTSFMFNQPQRIAEMVKSILRERSLDEIDDLIAHVGPSASAEQRQHFERLTMQARMVRSIRLMNRDISHEELMALPMFKDAIKRLFEIWSSNVEKLICELIQFARRLPDFASLPPSDQIVLIKGARSEVTTLVKCKHFSHLDDAYVDYRTDSGTICIIPMTTIRLLFTGVSSTQSDYGQLFARCMRQMTALHFGREHLALLCAIVLFSADREGLSDETRTVMVKRQEEMAQVLEYSLDKSHPKGKSMLSRFLMLLPILRELSHHNNLSILSAQERLNIDLSPLLFEVLPSTSVHEI